MTAQRALAPYTESSDAHDEGNSTLQWTARVHHFGETNQGFVGIPFNEDLFSNRGLLDEEPFQITNPTSFHVNSLGDVLYGFHEATLFANMSTVTGVPPEYELLHAIVTAPEDRRLEAMRALGLIEEEDDGYLPPGPDPQTVDFDLLARLEPGQQHS